MDFSKVTSILIPEGKVVSVSVGNKVLWRAAILSAPTISIDGDILTITTEDDKTETFAIFVDGVEMATVAKLQFSINGTTYYAEEGMTWGEWCESEYNTGGFYVDVVNCYIDSITNGEIGEGVLSDGTTFKSMKVVNHPNGKPVQGPTTIEPIEYHLYPVTQAGGGN